MEVKLDVAPDALPLDSKVAPSYSNQAFPTTGRKISEPNAKPKVTIAPFFLKIIHIAWLTHDRLLSRHHELD